MSEFSNNEPLYHDHELPSRLARREGSTNSLVRLAGVVDLRARRVESDRPGAILLPVTPIAETTEAGDALTSMEYFGLGMTLDQRQRHVLVTGASGSGKTYGVGTPWIDTVLRTTEDSAVILNTKGKRGTAEIAAMATYGAGDAEVITFAPFDLTRSVGWNVVAQARKSDMLPALVESIVGTVNNNSEDSFWSATARDLLSAVFACPSIKTIAHAYSLFTDTKTFRAFAESVAERHPQLLSFARENLESGSHNGATVFADVRGRLATLCAHESPRSVISSEDELDLDNLLRSGRRFVLVIECTETQFEIAKHLLNLFVSMLFGTVVRVADDAGAMLRPLTVFLDEFANVGHIPRFEVYINSLRSRGVSVVAFVQSTEQIGAVYGSAGSSVIAGFGTHVILCSGLSLRDREYFSRQLGNIQTEEIIETEVLGLDGWQRSQRTFRTSVRALLTPEDFMMPPHPVFGGFAVVAAIDHAPVLLHFTPAWEIGRIQDAMETGRVVGPPERTSPLPVVSGRLDLGSNTSGARHTNVRGWSDERIREQLEQVKKQIGYKDATGSAKKWWDAFEGENGHRIALVLRLAEELAARDASITEYFLAFVYANTRNIMATLHYLDYTRLKKEEEPE